MTIASEISRLQWAKADICTAIENKGVTVWSIKLDQYCDCINAISWWADVGYIDFLMVWWWGGGWTAWNCSPWWWGWWWWFVESFCQAVYNQQYPVKIWKWWKGVIWCSFYSWTANQDARWWDTVFYWVAYWWWWWGCSVCEDWASWWWWVWWVSPNVWWSAVHWNQWCSTISFSNCCHYWWWWAWAWASSTGPIWWNGKCSSMSWTSTRYSWWWWGGTKCTSSSCAKNGGSWWWGKWWYNCLNWCNATYYWWGGGWAASWYSSTHANWWNWCQWIVIIRYKTDGTCWVKCATWWTITTSGWYTIHTFTSDGIFTPIL